MNIVVVLENDIELLIRGVIKRQGLEFTEFPDEEAEVVDQYIAGSFCKIKDANIFVNSESGLNSVKSNFPLSFLKEKSRIVVCSSQKFVSQLAMSSFSNSFRIIEMLLFLNDYGVKIEWSLILSTDEDIIIERALLSNGGSNIRVPPDRLSSFGWCNQVQLAKAISSVLPLFHTNYRPAEMCANDCMVDGEIFAKNVNELGFSSCLWGELSQSIAPIRQGRGVLYIAFGEKYIDIAKFSVASLKRHSPGLRAALVTDATRDLPDFDYVINPPGAAGFIDKYFRTTSRMESMKFIAFPFSPFEETLFLDCDTFITAPVDEIFDQFPAEDIVLTNESQVALDAEGQPVQRTSGLTDPRSYNAGVFMFRSTIAAERYLTAWWAWFLWDQAGPGRLAGNWGHSGVADQSVLHLMVWSEIHQHIGAKLSFAPNTVYNATDRIWTMLHRMDRWDEARILHSKLPYHLRGTPGEHQLWELEWPRSWA